MELKKNILEQWWNSVIGFRAEVFGISTLHASKDRTTERDGQLRVVDTENLRQILSQGELSKDQLIQKLQTHIQNGASLRTSLFQGNYHWVLYCTPLLFLLVCMLQDINQLV
jgi:DNA polymerase gamma 2